MILPSVLLAMPGYKHEAVYSDLICGAELKGIPTNYGSLKPDCETAFAVVEFDWAVKHKVYECLGQALAYAAYTKKHPVCYIMSTTDDNHKMAESFRGSAELGGIDYIVKRVKP